MPIIPLPTLVTYSEGPKRILAAAQGYTRTAPGENTFAESKLHWLPK